MDDFLIYLLFAAFALLSRFLTKKKEPQANSGENENDEDSTYRPQRQPTFEELLKEFTQDTTPAPKPQAKPVIQNEYKSYENERYEVENYEERYQRDEEAREVYKRSIQQARKMKKVDALADYNKVKTKLDEPFDAYHQERKPTLADEIRKQLQNSNEVRKAVIYSEILHRKY